MVRWGASVVVDASERIFCAGMGVARGGAQELAEAKAFSVEDRETCAEEG